MTDPDGTFVTYCYDDAHRLTDVTDGAGNTIHYTLDPSGNRAKEDIKDASGNLTHTLSRLYNRIGQLATQATAEADPSDFSYDATGNRLSAQVNGATQAYTYPTNNHRLASVAGAARSYDAAGNTTAIDGTARTFAYDATGRMSQATRNGTLAMEYRYNERGEQVRRFLGATNTTPSTTKPAIVWATTTPTARRSSKRSGSTTCRWGCWRGPR
ncbi:YD repeat-containing protein [Xanthomonas arboricola]|nr:YD repeat-containing protein [Xanthomonas sp. 3307]